MLITRTSPLTGKTLTLDLDITEDQIREYETPGRVRLIQEIFPSLTADQREFVLTGYTNEDWEQMFPPEGEQP